MTTRIAPTGTNLAPLLVVLVATLALLAACTSAGGLASGSPEPSVASDAPPAASASAPASVDPGVSPSPGVLDLPAGIVDPVIAEIAGLAGVAPAAVTVVSAELMTFPDGALGCPKPGMSYTQAIVEGYKIVAVAAGTTYDYRGTVAGDFRRCR